MEDSKKGNIFGIDINSLNANLKEYLLSHLKDIWGQVGEFTDVISIHLGMIEVQEEGIWKDNLDAYVYSEYIKEGYKKIEYCVSDKEEDFLWNVINEGKENLNQNKIVEINESIGCGGIGTEEAGNYSEVIGRYKLFWYIENIGERKSMVFELVMKLIADFLKNSIADIAQIGFQEVNFLEDNAFREIYKRYNFIEKYVELIFKQYNELPSKEICCELSKTPYEKRECRGKILLSHREAFDSMNMNEGKIIFENTNIEMSSNRIFDVRKMLEVCQENTYLVVGKEKGKESAKKNDKFLLGFIHSEKSIEKGIVLNFKGESHWTISIEGEEVLFYKRDRYSISRKEYLKKHITDLREVEGLEIVNIEKILKELDKTEHGALMIIAHDAKRQAERLCGTYNRGTLLKDFSLEKEENRKMIGGMASVDGAILVDFQGNCVAFGVILDGEAKIRGETERGARYNSSKNYIAGENRIAIIVSEDKGKGIKIENGNRIKVIPNPKEIISQNY